MSPEILATFLSGVTSDFTRNPGGKNGCRRSEEQDFVVLEDSNENDF